MFSNPCRKWLLKAVIEKWIDCGGITESLIIYSLLNAKTQRVFLTEINIGLHCRIERISVSRSVKGSTGVERKPLFIPYKSNIVIRDYVSGSAKARR